MECPESGSTRHVETIGAGHRQKFSVYKYASRLLLIANLNLPRLVNANPSKTMSYPPHKPEYNGGAPRFPQMGYPFPAYSNPPAPPQSYQTGYVAPQSAYGGFYPPPSGEPVFLAPQHVDYNTQYPPQYRVGYGAAPPSQQMYSSHETPPPQPNYSSHMPPPFQPNYASYNTPPSQTGYPSYSGAEYGTSGSHESRSRSPFQYPPQASPHPHQAHATPPTPQSAELPMKFTFAQKDGFDDSGSIKDASGKTVYKLKDEADKHSWTASFKSRPLLISRADGTKVALFHWKDSADNSKLECFAVWGKASGKGTKLKVNGEILDQDLKFRLPNGQFYEWDGPTETGQYNLLDHQQMQGEGFDAEGKAVARYTPHSANMDAALDILPEALAVPNLLDATIMTTFQLEWAADSGTSTGEVLAAVNQALSR
ncbi:hypothetical protein EUX98_g523 [Antrodiella citrinella]|uniref:DUF6593 domain-containing protein n=1 Tax=Antrodiella citrinella TaxID=2447956 RepID=A0A4S4N6N1_9APHY|nr:hypothetical protein EUX98_g523 [Antrodiella citrinella]